MIRFLPDSWVDVLLRPLDMAAPEANSYVEIAAPDVRLAAGLLLAAAVLVVWRRRTGSARAAFRLLALLLLSMTVWLATTGNGRYFITWLVLLGPLCIGFVRLLPITGRRKVALAGALVALQLFVLSQNSPWAAWSWLTWKEPPYFQVDTPPPEPATYVTIANISYSIVAPQFPAESRWIGLGGGIATRDAPAVDRILSTSPRLVLIAPAIPAETMADGKPSEAAATGIARLLQPHGLTLKAARECSHLKSGGLLRISHRQGDALPPEKAARYGFWLCPLDYRGAPAANDPGEQDPQVNAAFQAMERLCPRFFTSGGLPMKINGGWLKNYDSDTKVYVLDSGQVWFKFWRSLNAVNVGTADALRAGRVAVDCSAIRAPNWRRGGP